MARLLPDLMARSCPNSYTTSRFVVTDRTSRIRGDVQEESPHTSTAVQRNGRIGLRTGCGLVGPSSEGPPALTWVSEEATVLSR
jgi:hypothetical protein